MVQAELNRSLIYALRQMSRATYANAQQNPNTLVYANRGERGEIVSYKLINELKGVKIYKIVYNSLDNRNGLVNQMSGTLYVPNDIKFQRIVSHKHGTYTTLDDNVLGHQLYRDSSAPANFELNAASLGNVVITSDGVGYGESAGRLHYLDYCSETMSQVDAVRAVRNLCLKNKSIFPNSTMTATSVVDVFQTGYSLGGMFCVSIANELTVGIPEKSNFRVINVVCGAAINASNITKTIGTLPLLGQTTANHKVFYGLAYFICLYFYTRREEALLVMKPHVIRNVLPLFEDVYARGLTESAFINLFSQTLYNSMVANNPLSYTIDPLSATSKFDVRLMLNTDQLANFDISEEECDFTNRFASFRSLSNSPVSVIYSLGDELSVYNGSDGCALYDNRINGLLNKTPRTVNGSDTPAGVLAMLITIKGLKTDEYLRVPVASALTHRTFAPTFYGMVIELLKN
jgi:hypothetical protein